MQKNDYIIRAEAPGERRAVENLIRESFWNTKRIIYKTRYYIPYGKYTIELDVFEKDLKGLCYAEVEFSSIKELKTCIEPNWFLKDVSKIKKYSNESLAYSIRNTQEKI